MKITLMGLDDLGRWVLSDYNAKTFPLVEKWDDHQQFPVTEPGRIVFGPA